LETQVKLLRVLQEREVTPLGSRKVIKVDARVIAATNIDLKAAVERGRFREDLYWRLNVVKLVLPSLRERREDIPLIVDMLVERFNKELGLAVKAIDSSTRQLLEMYDWPGNVRELENAVCSAMIMCEGDTITVDDLPPRIRGEVDELALGPDASSAIRIGDITKMPLADAVKEATERLEKRMIISSLADNNSNRTATAESLGISRKSLFNKMQQYGLGDGEGGDST
jgi:DNA-binding NtrC family response regulator